MFLKKEGFPEEGELVLCSVTSVQYHSVFVQIDEYNKTGMIHISEVAPGRIRNIRDFVIEGKKIVCKVLKIHLDRGHIDLSLRRVSDNQKRLTITGIKMQQNAEKILEHVAKTLGIKPEDLFAKVHAKAVAQSGSLYGFFQNLVKDEKVIEIVNQRVKTPEVEIVGKLKLSTYSPDGIDAIKKSLAQGLLATSNAAQIKYLGSGTFRVSVKSPDYKSAEKILQTFVDEASAVISKADGTAEFTRAEA